MKGENIGKFYFSLFVGFILVVMIAVISHKKKMRNHINIKKTKEINGVLIKVSTNRSSAYCVLKDGRKVFIFDSDNLNYEPYALNKFLKKGDSIVKPPYSDTLFIYRDKEKYFFILGKRIGEKK